MTGLDLGPGRRGRAGGNYTEEAEGVGGAGWLYISGPGQGTERQKKDRLCVASGPQPSHSAFLVDRRMWLSRTA